ncbi:MAG TPA: AtpZ/AtpI family protein, partial [Pirellulales bacterium]|nr:AtpZ/AtpI family protein [Pirellulales bacterium]
MNDQGHEEDQFVGEIRRRARRAQAAQHVTFWRGVNLVGTIGWMVSVPTVLGALIGRMIDSRFASGVFWTLSLLVAGVTLGCASAWRHVQ